MDIADFLQIVPTPDGCAYLVDSKGVSVASLDRSEPGAQIQQDSLIIESKDVKLPDKKLHSDNEAISRETHGTETLVKAWKSSALFKKMMLDMDDNTNNLGSDNTNNHNNGQAWPEDLKEKFPGTSWYQFGLALERQKIMFIRDKGLIITHILQNILVGAVGGALFNNIPTENVQSTLGFLFFGSLFGSLGHFTMIPGIYKQKAVYKKHNSSLIVSATSFNLSFALVLLPLQILEAILFGTIMYWSAGMCPEAGRFLTYLLLNLVNVLVLGQVFQAISYALPSPDLAQPLCGSVVGMMVFFSGFILPPGQIPDWWIWYYYINPVAYAFKAVVINEYTCPRYDFKVPTSRTTSQRFGNIVLEVYG